MDETCTYQIKVRNGLDDSAFNATSPVQVTLARVDAGATYLTLRADQSGLIGLLRHLHQQGYVLLSVSRERLEHGG